MTTPLSLQQLLDRPEVSPLLDDAQARALEAEAADRQPPHHLMAHAGDAVARLALACYPHARRIVVLCGPGNNGGDGLVAATALAARGRPPQVWLPYAQRDGSEAHWALARARDAGVQLHTGPQPPEGCNAGADLCIDALFGAGLRAPIDPALCDAVARLRGVPLLAVDLPSGINGDTGRAVGGVALHADVTLALLTLRPGHFTGDAADHVGALWFDDLGVQAPPHGSASLLTHGTLHVPQRAATLHKGQAGDVWVVGGADSMTGAPLLTARAALACGAGRVYVHLLAEPAPLAVDPASPELMLRAHLELESAACVAFGPGAGVGPAAARALRTVLGCKAARVIDADGLNLLAAHDDLRALLSPHGAQTVLTPHPLEAARLLGSDVRSVQEDRLAGTQRLAQQTGCIVVLKGAGTVIAAPDGRRAVNPTGGPRLATPGSGDVLTGVIAALMAQGLDAWSAACAGVYAHGAAADGAGSGDVLTASHQPRAVSAVLASLRRRHPAPARTL